MDFLKLALSIFIILPIVSITRELGYVIASKLFGAKETKITIGSGPHFFKFWLLEVRKYYFMYSWCSYDSLRTDAKLAHIIIYSSPIVANVSVAFIINALLANDMLDMVTFWNQFIFYSFYFVLFDAIPMYYPDGQPSSGRVIFDLIRYGKRSDFERSDPQLDTTTYED
ncbi:hypothetical protein ACFQ3N_07550 [Virgibacillus byunsanensis]|uniref:Uncharacterized protein n=1 Tax=Virgibacillus byunsanensis TaxID=570945 RepID=A0ABW3LLG0_9BACI